MSHRPRGLRRAAAAAFLFMLSSGHPASAAERIELVSRAVPGQVSETGGSESTFPEGFLGRGPQTVSADGRYVVFASASTNLVPGQVDHNFSADIFLHDRVAGTTRLVSHNPASPSATADWGSSDPSISADGRYVAFLSSATNLTAAPHFQGTSDVFVFDRDTGVVTLASHAAGASGAAGDDMSHGPMISADGNWVVYVSRAGNLVPGQTEYWDADDVFLWERATNTSTLVSHDRTSTALGGNDHAFVPAVSADGSWVAYTSLASNLAEGVDDFNGQTDVYLWERAANANRLVSRSSASATTPGNGRCHAVRITPDGATLLFVSSGTGYVAGLTDANLDADAFLYDRASGGITLVSHSADDPARTGSSGLSDVPSLSADGNWVAFASSGTDFVSGQSDTNGAGDVFLWSRASNALELVTRQPGLATTTSASAAGGLSDVQVSADGSFVAYATRATELITGQSDTNGAADLFLFTRATGTNALVSGSGGSATATADGLSRTPVFSADGQWLAFVTAATDVIPGLADTNEAEDVLLHHRTAGTAALVSRRDTASPSDTAGGPSVVPFIENGTLLPVRALPALSADGRFLAFQSASRRLIPGQVDQADREDSGHDVFHYDRLAGTIRLVSRADGTTTTTGNGVSHQPVISADGRWVAFLSRATDLIAGQVDTNNADDVFLWDSQTGAMTLVSRTAASAVTAAGTTWPVAPPVINADGSWIGFLSNGSDLVAGQIDGAATTDLFLFSRASGTNTLVSHDRTGLLNAAGTVSEPLISADGATLAFLTGSAVMVNGQNDPTNSIDLFLWDRATGGITLVSHGPDATTTVGATFPAMSADGNWLAFSTISNAVIPGVTDTNALPDLFLWDRSTGARTLVSHTAGSATTAGNSVSQGVMLSADGSRLAFLSHASNLVAGQNDTNDANDAFVFQRPNGQIFLASHTPAGGASANSGPVRKVAISADGSRVTFLSAAYDLVSGQTEVSGSIDLFSYDVAGGAVRLLSHRHAAAGGATAGLTASSEMAVPSADGKVVAFSTLDGDVVPNDYNLRHDVFLWIQDASEGDYFTLAPCRLLDTRRPEDGPALAHGEVGILTVHDRCGVPFTARAVVVNVTAVGGLHLGQVLVYPGDLPELPTPGFLPVRAGRTIAMFTALPLATDGSGTLKLEARLLPAETTGTVHVVVDVMGYFE